MTEDKTSDLIKAAAELAKAVPVYDDLLQPGAKQVGKSLELIGRTVNVVLAPLQAVVWGFEQFNEFLSTTVAEKLANTPEKDIGTPKANIAGPLLESLRYAGSENELRDMYANLLAEAIDQRTSNGVLPSFVEILKQLSSDEARLIKYFASESVFPMVHITRRNRPENPPNGAIVVSRNVSFFGSDAGCKFPSNTPAYIDNLSRLGLINIFPDMEAYSTAGTYDRLQNDATIKQILKSLDVAEKFEGDIIQSGVKLTMLGHAFIQACVVPHDSKDLKSERS